MTASPHPFPLTVVTIGVADMKRSIAFYDALGLRRRVKESGEAVAFYDAGGVVLGLFPWDQLADDAALADAPRPQAFRGMTLARNCNSEAEVDAMMAHALKCGGTLVRPASKTSYGGYRGYFADPDGHAWEAVVAPGIVVKPDGQVELPD